MTPNHEARRVRVTVNHVGVSVTDLEKATEWYRTVLGMELIRGPLEFDAANPSAAAHRDVFGPQWGGVRIAFLTTANGVGVELFQFTEPAAVRRAENFDYWRSGIFHMCVTTEDVAALAGDIEAMGGRQRSEIHETRPGVHTCYCEDPDGNILEITSANFEVQNANRWSRDIETGLHAGSTRDGVAPR